MYYETGMRKTNQTGHGDHGLAGPEVGRPLFQLFHVSGIGSLAVARAANSPDRPGHNVPIL